MSELTLLKRAPVRLAPCEVTTNLQLVEKKKKKVGSGKLKKWDILQINSLEVHERNSELQNSEEISRKG